MGVTIAAITIGGVLVLLNNAWGFGSKELGAPQATLMKMIVEGVMDNNLPWGLVFVGIFIALTVEILGIPVLPFAIGVYLPVHLNACIMAGGLVRLLFEKAYKDKERKENIINNGILYCSGLIAGEGLMGILLAVFAVIGIEKYIDISSKINLPNSLLSFESVVIFLLIIGSLILFSTKKEPQ